MKYAATSNRIGQVPMSYLYTGMPMRDFRRHPAGRGNS